MEIRSRQDLVEYLPDDAPWIFYHRSVDTVRAQCVKRGLEPSGNVMELFARLDKYYRLHPGDERRIFPWHYCDNPLYVGALEHAENHTYHVIEIEDNSDDTSVEKRFTLRGPYSDRRFYIIIGRISRCSCPFQREEGGRKNYTCGHIVYVLRYVLDCPEPLRWQQALLFKEVHAIFRYSTAFLYAANRRECYPNRQCALCFRGVQGADVTISSYCGLFVHRDCQDKAQSRGLDYCVLHFDGMLSMGTDAASAAAFNDALLAPPSEDGSDNDMVQSSSDDDGINIAENGDGNDPFSAKSANKSIEFFAERSQISHHSPLVTSSRSPSGSPVVIKQEPESPCPSPRRQLPSRAAKDAVLARPDAYTGSSPRRQVPTLAQKWTPKVSTTPIPLPAIPGFTVPRSQPVGGSQPARRVGNAVPAPIVSASAKLRFGRSKSVGCGSPLLTITETDASPSPALATVPSISGFCDSGALPEGAQVACFSPSSPPPALQPPRVEHEVDPFVSFPIPPAGSTFASISILSAGNVSSPINNGKKKKKKTSPKKKRTVITTDQASTAHDQSAAASTFHTAATGTTGHQGDVDKVKADKEERRKEKLLKRLLRLVQLEEESKRVKNTKKYVEKVLARLKKKRRKEMNKIARLCGRIGK